MKLIVGLGNPGEEHEKTRHNLGFMAVERFLHEFEPVNRTEWEDSGKFKSDIVQLDWKPKEGVVQNVILVKPKTYMNNSGMAVSQLASFYKINTEDIWILHDDIDLPLGAFRIRFGGSSAGHNGIDSIMESLQTEKFWRFRLGIGHPHRKGEGEHKEKLRNVDDFVLGQFSGSEKGKARELIERGAKALSMALEEGLEVAMHKYNSKQ